MRSDLIKVYYAADVAEADIVAAWLEEQGIRTFVKDRLAVGMLQLPLTVAPKGVAVCVGNEEEAERARLLLVEHFIEVRRQHEPSASGEQAAAICESCGVVSMFPFEHRGSVQNCPHCREYVDVPGGEASEGEVVETEPRP